MSESVDIFKQRSIEEAWNTAKASYAIWKNCPIDVTDVFARQIALTALVSKHDSIWFEVFKNEKKVLDEIRNAINNKKK